MLYKSVTFFILLSIFLFFSKTRVDAAPKEFDKRTKALETFGKQLANKNGMKYLIAGVGSVVDSRIVAWDISLTCDREMTVEQARPMVVNMIQDFWQKVNQDPVFVTCLKIMHQKQPQYDPVLTPKRMGMKIAFWDKNVDRPLPPNLAQIKVMEGSIYYFQANPKDQSLQDPFVESFDDAFAKVQQPKLQ
jgi:hypothetical protein